MMSKEPSGQKPPKPDKLPRKPRQGEDSRAMTRPATEREVGDTADEIMRTPKKKR